MKRKWSERERVAHVFDVLYSELGRIEKMVMEEWDAPLERESSGAERQGEQRTGASSDAASTVIPAKK